MKKKVLVALMVLILASLLFACAEKDAPGPESMGPSSADEEEEKDAPGPESQGAETDADADSDSETDADAETHDETPINIAALKGPTAMGMVEMMDGAESGTLDGHEYNFQLLAAPDEVAPLVIQGKVDIAAVPANLASVIYNKSEGAVQVININTLGVLYIVENGDSVKSIADLSGKTIYASGQGATPEYALRYILSGNGIDPDSDVTIEWKAEHAECLSALLADESGIAMLPQPFVTTALGKADTLRVALDLTEEWSKIVFDHVEPSEMVTGVTIVRKEFAEAHPEAVDDFLNHYAESVAFVNENAAEAAQLIEKFDIVPAAVAEKAIPNCNIVCITGEEMKAALSGYLQVLADQNPQAVGGALPQDDFYFE